jgi:hypothetical protein
VSDAGQPLRQAQGLTLHLLKQVCHPSCALRLPKLRSGTAAYRLVTRL